jgi:uncharacterized RDD family membrane protein YckC
LPFTAPAKTSTHLSEPETPRSSKPPTLPQIAPPLPGLVPAPMRQRCMAWAIDWAVLFLPVLIVFAFAYGVWWIEGPLEHRDPETARQEQALLWRNLRELVFTTGRHAAKYLSALPLFLGFMAAFFNPQRLTWHDRLAGTRVVER